MEKRRGQSEGEISETLIGKAGGGVEMGKEEGGFFACYLLASLSPRHKGHTYIGFTVNPCRRIRQHNGEIRCGAWRTKNKRPWEMVLCIYGFSTNVSALQFEWAWQHPKESLAVRKAAASFKSLSGVANKIKLAYTMLSLPAWQSLNLTVNFFSTKYTKHSAGCPGLLAHMKVQVCPMDELPCYMESNQTLYRHENKDDWDDDEECGGIVGAYVNLHEGLATAAVNCSAAYQNRIERTSDEQFGQDDENGVTQPRESSTLKDHREPFYPINSLGKTTSSITSLHDTEETVEDGDSIRWIEESSFELGITARKPLQVTASDQQSIGRCTVSREVEVIDVLTPSTDCRISLCAKKRRVSVACPEIIDLTKSPIFVQL